MVATWWQPGGNLVATWWQHGGNVVATWWQPGGNLVATCWQPGGNLVAAWWQLGGNLVATWWQLGGNMVATWWQHGGNLMATWWQLGGKFQRAKTSGVVLFVVVAWVHFQSEKKFFVGAAFSTDVFLMDFLGCTIGFRNKFWLFNVSYNSSAASSLCISVFSSCE